MLDQDARTQIAEALGEEVDSVVRDHYPSLSQEPAITSRVGQRLEDQLDGRPVGDYRLRVITQDFPDRGQGAWEKRIGADLFLSVSLEGPDGFDKGLIVQTKLDRRLDRLELQDQVAKMRRHTPSSYVWIYTDNGVAVVSAHEVERMQSNSLAGLYTRSATGFFGRILDCYAGSRRLGVPPVVNRRAVLTQRLLELRARRGLDVAIEPVASAG
jgi:hypothetical protein